MRAAAVSPLCSKPGHSGVVGGDTGLALVLMLVGRHGGVALLLVLGVRAALVLGRLEAWVGPGLDILVLRLIVKFVVPGDNFVINRCLSPIPDHVP